MQISVRMYSSARRSVHEISNKYNLKNVCEVKLTAFVIKIARNANKSTLVKRRRADIQHHRRYDKRI
jgi:hypothetical protein